MGFGFEIDHYDPLEHAPEKERDYDNLMYSCSRCNKRKSKFYPTDQQRDRGLYVLRIDQEDPQPHFESDKLLWEGRTITGEFNIERLDLNRGHLVRIRRLRQRLHEARAFIAYGVREILQTSLDVVNPEYRPALMTWHERVILDEVAANQSVEDFIKSCVASPATPDTESPSSARRRREHLADMLAIAPIAGAVPSEPRSPAPRTYRQPRPKPGRPGRKPGRRRR